MSRKQLDWEAIERDYRLGQLSLRALATKHGTTAGAISKKAKAGDWVQDASQEVRERTRAALLTVGRKEEAEKTEGNSVSNAGNAPTREDIEVAVLTNIEVVTRHRRDVGHGHHLVGMLFRQLEDAAANREQLENDIEVEAGDDGRRRAAMLKAVSLPMHATILRDLSTALKNLIPLERQAYNLDEQQHEASYEERLAKLMEDK